MSALAYEGDEASWDEVAPRESGIVPRMVDAPTRVVTPDALVEMLAPQEDAPTLAPCELRAEGEVVELINAMRALYANGDIDGALVVAGILAAELGVPDEEIDDESTVIVAERWPGRR